MLSHNLNLYLVFLLVTLLSSISLTYAQTVNISSYNVSIGDTIKIPIMASNAYDIAGALIKISYDSSMIVIESIEEGDLEKPEYYIENGFVNIAAASAEECGKYSCTIAYMIVKGVSEGCTKLEIVDIELADIYGNVITPKVKSGEICVLTKKEVFAKEIKIEWIWFIMVITIILTIIVITILVMRIRKR